MSYVNLLISFWGYTLKIAQYLLNLVPSKVISTTPKELWTGRKPSLGHVRIWGSPAHVLKRDPSKLEARSEIYLFVGSPEGQKVIYFMILRSREYLLAQTPTSWNRIIF